MFFNSGREYDSENRAVFAVNFHAESVDFEFSRAPLMLELYRLKSVARLEEPALDRHGRRPRQAHRQGSGRREYLAGRSYYIKDNG